jgi:hypothetical protein
MMAPFTRSRSLLREQKEQRMQAKRQTILILSWMVFLSAGGFGQESSSQLRGQVHFSAFKPTSGEAKSLLLGGGLEVSLGRGLGLGVESGHLYTPEKGTGIFSATGTYQFRLFDILEPFASAGYTRAYGGSTANLLHVGGGITRWLNDHAGLRLEMRDYVSKNLWPSGARHTLEYRFAVVLR